ncbi:MAG: uroporphyrinogen decarboxylase family protein [Acidobacteriota bacterium]|nr:uroporphyrinogen decarboxylase family protein [Acidobacteriota bacterium]
MSDIIEIGIPVEEIEARRARVAEARRFGRPDRVPVIPALAHRFLIPKTGTSFRDYYADPETMLRTQIRAQKWHLENIRTDAHVITGPWVGAWSDFQNSFEAGSLGCRIEFPENDIPWVASHWVQDDTDLTRLEAMDFIGSGLNARQVEFRDGMIRVAEKYPVRFLGGLVFYPGARPSLTRTSDGPFGIAGDLMGATELFLACAERPDFVRELLRIIIDKMLAWLDFACDLEGLPEPRDIAWSDDLAVSLSAGMFKDLVLPADCRIRSHFRGNALFHMCGKSDHLLEIFRDSLDIHEFQGFGWAVDLDRIREVMSGRIVLYGNVDPRIILSGTPAEVMEASRKVIEKLAPGGGFVLQDGNNVAPGSPIENINAMMKAAESYGRYD